MSDSKFASLGQKELEGEKEAYRIMSTDAVVSALKIVSDAAEQAFACCWSDPAQEALLQMDRGIKQVNAWKEQMEEEVL